MFYLFILYYTLILSFMLQTNLATLKFPTADSPFILLYLKTVLRPVKLFPPPDTAAWNSVEMGADFIVWF